MAPFSSSGRGPQSTTVDTEANDVRYTRRDCESSAASSPSQQLCGSRPDARDQAYICRWGVRRSKIRLARTLCSSSRSACTRRGTRSLCSILWSSSPLLSSCSRTSLGCRRWVVLEPRINKGEIRYIPRRKPHSWSAAQPALTALTYPVQVIKVATDVIPKPTATAVQHHAVLLAIVIVRLVLSPGRFLHDLA